ncbi:MAG: glycosyltransferase family 2 protein [Lysobacterales bacterium]
MPSLMAREPLSVVVTTFNSAATLERCLASVAWAEDLVVLDSGSDDATRDIAERFGARCTVQPFRGYALQKQDAIDSAQHAWVLLLDSDEALAAGAREIIEAALEKPQAQGFTLPRREHVFWRLAHRGIRQDHFLRLFDRTVTLMSGDLVHESPRCSGRVDALDAQLLHWGQPDIATKVDKLNRYSTLAADDATRQGSAGIGSGVRMIWYPAFVFWRQYLFKRHFLNGWPGFIAARSMAFHALMKDAKRLERRKKGD